VKKAVSSLATLPDGEAKQALVQLPTRLFG
jgi:hypothetical protein